MCSGSGGGCSCLSFLSAIGELYPRCRGAERAWRRQVHKSQVFRLWRIPNPAALGRWLNWIETVDDLADEPGFVSLWAINHANHDLREMAHDPSLISS